MANRRTEAFTQPWVVVSPNGVTYVGLHSDESEVWAIALGWPSEEEVADRRRNGWYAVPAQMTWRRPA